MIRFYLLLALITISIYPQVNAHQFAPALLELEELDSQQIKVRWKEPVIRVMGSQLQPVLPVDCTNVTTPNVNEIGSGRVSQWNITCSTPLIGKTVAVENIASSGANVLLRIKFLDGHTLRQVLSPDTPRLIIPDRENKLVVFIAYVKLGIEHILTGPDHLLFVLGLTLLVRGGKRLLATITAFTIGHSITLALAALGWIHLSTRPIEAAIALSIYILAVELTNSNKSNFLSTYPWLMAGAFGLLHGLGFAGALVQVGLPDGDIPLALFSFNVGIECGQLAFISVVLAVWFALRKLPIKWPSILIKTPAYVIGSLSVFWFLQRI
jgi:hydrogenase/urease accessory protein HupE